MEMREGLIASGLGHAAVFGWALVAGVFNSPVEAPDFQVTEVSVITSAEFQAMTSDIDGFEAAEAPTLSAPEVPEVPAPAPEATEAPRPTPAPAATPAPAPESVPAPVPPMPRAEVAPDSPAAPEAPAADPTLPQVADRPTPRPATRVAPTPAPKPPQDAEVAPVVQQAPAPAETGETVTPAPKPTAPEEAAPEIVTEAEIPSGAPNAAPRPQRRPAPPPETAQTPPAETGLADAIAGALEQVAPPQTAPSGPPLSGAEVEGFRLSVQRCWNVGSLSSQALRTKVTIAFAMNRDGTPVASSLAMIAFEGGDEAAARQAYEAGRRAIIRCGADGFDLPVEKYEYWREIEMTFNPEQMRIR